MMNNFQIVILVLVSLASLSVLIGIILASIFSVRFYKSKNFDNCKNDNVTLNLLHQNEQYIESVKALHRFFANEDKTTSFTIFMISFYNRPTQIISIKDGSEPFNFLIKYLKEDNL